MLIFSVKSAYDKRFHDTKQVKKIKPFSVVSSYKTDEENETIQCVVSITYFSTQFSEERERERQRQRQTDRQTDRQTQRERERERERERNSD